MILEKNFYRFQSHPQLHGLNFEFDIERKVKLRFKVKAKIRVRSDSDFNRLAHKLLTIIWFCSGCIGFLVVFLNSQAGLKFSFCSLKSTSTVNGLHPMIFDDSIISVSDSLRLTYRLNIGNNTAVCQNCLHSGLPVHKNGRSVYIYPDILNVILSIWTSN